MITIELEPGDSIELMTAEGHSMLIHYADIIQAAQLPDATPIDEGPRLKDKKLESIFGRMSKRVKTTPTEMLYEPINDVPPSPAFTTTTKISKKGNDIVLSYKEQALLSVRHDIAAIKSVRNRVGIGLKEAKEAVDYHLNNFGRPDPTEFPPLDEDTDL